MDTERTPGIPLRAARLWVGTALALVAPSVCFAQTTGSASEQAPVATAQNTPSQDASAANAGVAEIVVYGLKLGRGEVVQKAPEAITAVSPTILKQTNSVDITDVGALAPNVQTATVGTIPAFPNFTIRGIGLNASIPSVDPPINVIQDGMVIVLQGGSLASTFDLESVELDRGPQGVLFGRNATGGAISVRTAPPSSTPQALIDVSYGNYNTLDANMSVGGPLAGDSVLAKLAVLYRRTDGFVENTNEGIFSGNPVGNPTGTPVVHPTGLLGSQNELTIKPTFLFHLTSNDSLTLFTQYETYNDGGSVPINWIDPTGPVVPLESLFGFTPTATGYKTNVVDPGSLKLREGHVIADLEDHVGVATISTTLAWRDISYINNSNTSGGPFPLFFLNSNQKNDQVSLESRVNAPITSFADFLAGLYLLDTTTDIVETRFQASPTVASPTNAIYTQGLFDQVTRAGALFANFDWHFRDNITLSTGGRYSVEEKTFNGSPLLTCIGQGYFDCPTHFVRGKKQWGNFSPRVVLDWQITPGSLAYASYTDGFRSGNYNSRSTNATALAISASPEYVTSYEIGIKNDLLDRRLRVNIDGFVEDYKNIQQVLTTNIAGVGQTQVLLNAASARIRGFEAEITAKPISSWELTANAGITDAKYLSFNAVVPGVANPVSLQFARVPKYDALIASTYRWSMAGLRGDFSWRVSYNWQSQYFSDLSNTPDLQQKPYGLLNSNLEYDQDNWSVALFGRNITNTDYVDVKARSLSYVQYGGQPFTFGIRFTDKFQ